MIYVAVLLIALAVLAWDRTSGDRSVTNPKFVTAVPSPPRAVSLPTLSQNAPTRTPAAASFAPAPTKHPFNLLSLFGKTDRSKTPAHTKPFTRSAPRDLFAPSTRFRQMLCDPVAKEQAATQNLLTLNLSACLVGKNGGTAIINGHVFTVGDQLGAFKLTAVHEDRIIIASDKRTIALFFDGPPEILSQTNPRSR